MGWGESNLEKEYKLEYTAKMEKSIRKLAEEDKELFAEVRMKLQLFQKGEFEKLEIKPIKRQKQKHKISEIVIKSPGSYRLFYVVIDTKNKTAVFIDGRKKKKQKFNTAYFSQLDKSLDRYLDGRN
jgi:mRNA-degrading endonuclease RelE of RelBE toxin-antitoxin system